MWCRSGCLVWRLHHTHTARPASPSNGDSVSQIKWILINTNYNLHSKNNERKSEQAHIPQAPTLLENDVYNEWQFQALVMGNRTEKQFHLSCTKLFWPNFKRDINCSLKGSNNWIKISCGYAHLHIMSLITTKFHELLLSGFRGVVLTNCFE